MFEITGRVELLPINGQWIMHLIEADDVAKIMGTRFLPTPYTIKAAPSTVLADIAARLPQAQVEIKP